jgi:tetratricopeptide (TPR) repeat protein
MIQAASPLALLQGVAESLPEAWVSAALARRSRALEAIVEQARQGDSWTATTALQLAHLWLVAGRPGRGDDLVLEAQQLLPEAGLIPDWWGLWPSSGETQASHSVPIALAESYIQVRHLPPLQAWKAWLEPVQADRSRCAEPALQLLLGLVIHGRASLPGALEPALEQLLGEDLVVAEPALAWRLLDPLCERMPEWNYARLKASDLSLQRGDLERCCYHLAQASAEQWQLAWLHDIAARHALAMGDVAKALEHWQQAITRCGEADADVVEIFRQRAREARRGPGVLQARSLLNRGQSQDAIALLEHLLEHDPQWQPLRSLLEQARGSGPVANIEAGRDASGDLERLERRLQQLAELARLSWPPAELPPARDAAAAERFVQEALGRLALLS